MWSPRTIGRALVLAAVVGALGTARATAAAQQPVKKPTADTLKKRAVTPKHIKVAKEGQAAGEVAPGISQAALDSAVAAERAAAAQREQYARDEQRRMDSIAADARLRALAERMRNEAAAARERARQDSIAAAQEAERQAALALKRHLARGFYFGVAGGASAPQQDLRTGYTSGWNVTVPFGWDANDSPFGIRTDFSVDRLGGTHIHNVLATIPQANLTVWSFNTDLKLRAHAPGGLSRTNVYALGGVGVHAVSSGVYGITGPNAGRILNFGDASAKFGWNAGAGFSVEWGPAEIFAEARYIQVKSDMPYHPNGGVGTYTAFTPIVVGVQWF